MRLDDLYRRCLDGLRGSSATPELDARLIVCHFAGIESTELITAPERSIAIGVESAIAAATGRRRRGEPLAHITGCTDFWKQRLEISVHTLVPRPETELLVELALERLPPDQSLTVADLGTGSGAIAIAIAAERPRCRVIAADISRAALDVARRNAAANGVDNVIFREGDWFEGFTETALDMVLANPPYVRSGDPCLADDGVRFDPASALVAGADGLDAIRHLVAVAPAHLAAGGDLLLEHGHDQGDAVRRLFGAAAFGGIRTFRDLNGHDRVTAGTTSG